MKDSIFAKIKSNPNMFPRFYAVLGAAAVEIRNKWEFMAGKRAEVSVKNGGLGWWGQQYLANGQIQIKRVGLGFRVFYDSNSSAYDFEKIAEKGRRAFDIASYLLSNSKKVRINARGKKFLIIPMKGKEKESASTVMKILSTSKVSSPMGGQVKRNSYSIEKIESKSRSNTVKFQQLNERGGSSTTASKMVVLTEDSNWEPYPEIKGQKFVQRMQEEADRVLRSSEFLKNLAEALTLDLKELYLKKKKK
ncbi:MULTISPECIES: hypothetical protein [Leptospira]|nr:MULTISPECIES: hypothetical protein [Leptospira]EMJ56516.1 hypothetical protein LEP1GSC111_1233 [Leptospira interrogans str. UT126]UML78856.1 hypothetical protein FH602_02490 [Leptospira kirschneri]UMQ60484.1 hypothetical protein FH585_21420 [Leptospira interrogans]UMQ60578.1 hypothetical protein FH585_21315 [Leptospira interrogans]